MATSRSSSMSWSNAGMARPAGSGAPCAVRAPVRRGSTASVREPGMPCSCTCRTVACSPTGSTSSSGRGFRPTSLPLILWSEKDDDFSLLTAYVAETGYRHPLSRLTFHEGDDDAGDRRGPSGLRAARRQSRDQAKRDVPAQPVSWRPSDSAAGKGARDRPAALAGRSPDLLATAR